MSGAQGLTRSLLSPQAAWWLAGAFLLAALVTWLALPPGQVEHLMQEPGPIEQFTAITYAVCGVAIWMLRDRRDDLRSTLAASAMVFALWARELSMHKSFTGTSVLRLSWYAGPASLGAKAVAAAVVLGVLTALVWLLVRHGRARWEGWRRREPLAVTLVVFVVVLVVAKVLDRSVSILLGDFGLAVPLRWVALRSSIEEWMELGLSALLLLGLFQHRAARAAQSP
jgi:hypothetical protein